MYMLTYITKSRVASCHVRRKRVEWVFTGMQNVAPCLAVPIRKSVLCVSASFLNNYIYVCLLYIWMAAICSRMTSPLSGIMLIRLINMWRKEVQAGKVFASNWASWKSGSSLGTNGPTRENNINRNTVAVLKIYERSVYMYVCLWMLNFTDIKNSIELQCILHSTQSTYSSLPIYFFLFPLFWLVVAL